MRFSRFFRPATPTAADPVPAPTLTPEYAIAALTTLVGLFATQGLISNGTEKIITGVASVLLPLVFVIVQAVLKSQAHKATVAIKLARAQTPRPIVKPTEPTDPPSPGGGSVSPITGV